MTWSFFDSEGLTGDDLGRYEKQFNIPIQTGWHVPPVLGVRGNDLIWRFPKSDEAVRLNWIEPSEASDIFIEFIRLADSTTDQEILNYAKRYGVLGLCEHGVPAAHNPPMRFPTHKPIRPESASVSILFRDHNAPRHKPLMFCSAKSERVRGEEIYSEPLDTWRRLSRHAKAMVTLAAELHRESIGEEEDWIVIGDIMRSYPGARRKIQTSKGSRKQHLSVAPDSVSEGRIRLMFAINQWMDWFGARPTFQWWEGAGFVLANRRSDTGLPAALSARLLMWVTGSRGTKLCASCGNPFLLRPGQDAKGNTYCESPGCGKRAAWKAASRRYNLQERENPDRDKRKAKLNETRVRAIRRKVKAIKDKTGKLSVADCRRLAEGYGVSQSTIHKIADGRTWSNVE